MTEPFIQVKLKTSGKIITVLASDALESHFKGVVDIAPDAEVKGASWDEIEKWRNIIGALYSTERSIPTVRYAMDAEELTKEEEAFMQVALKPIFEKNGNGWISKDDLLKVAMEQHPEFRHLKDPERRLRSLAQKKALYKTNSPQGVSYQMNPYYKKQREITA